MDYEIAYKESLKVAKNWMKSGDVAESTKKCLLLVFPELRELEDEKIRKSLVEFLTRFHSLGNSGNYDNWSKADCADWIAYLEKQKEPKDVSASTIIPSCWREEEIKQEDSEDEKIRKSLVEFLTRFHSLGNSGNYDNWSKADCADWIAYLEKQKEPKDVSASTIIPSCWREEEIKQEDSEDERIKKAITRFIAESNHSHVNYDGQAITKVDCLAWLEKQKEQKPTMIQWPGNNLKEVIEFTGKSPKFNEWFKSWEEYENYVHTHNDILKLFYEDGSHYEVPTGAWIVKTPDGHNVPSKAQFIEKPAEWSESVAKEMFIKALERAVEQTKKGCKLTDCDKHSWWEDFKAYSGIKPAEWSEEDERMRQDTIRFIETGWTDNGKSHLIPWLKALPERFALQPKQEWSGEDEVEIKVLDSIIRYIVEVVDKDVLERFGTNYEELFSWLKSLRPQPHWKPSETQMNVLKVSSEYESCIKNREHLKSLYNDLKKL